MLQNPGRYVFVTLNASARISIRCLSWSWKVLDSAISNAQAFGAVKALYAQVPSVPKVGCENAAGFRYCPLRAVDPYGLDRQFARWNWGPLIKSWTPFNARS